VQVGHGFSDLGCDGQLEGLREVLVRMDGCGERARQELDKDEGEHLFILVVEIRSTVALDDVRVCQAIERVHLLAKLKQDFFLGVCLHEKMRRQKEKIQREKN
jgi:hypothetical protein